MGEGQGHPTVAIGWELWGERVWRRVLGMMGQVLKDTELTGFMGDTAFGSSSFMGASAL